MCRLVLFVLAFISLSANAYPETTITLIVPFSKGGFSDTLARELSSAIVQKIPNAQIVVENVVGKGGTTGASQVAAAKPDGHTLLLHSLTLATAPGFFRSALAYKPIDDFEYIGLISEGPMFIIGRRSIPPRSFSELQKWLAANLGKVTLAVGGLGTASNLCALQLQQIIKIEGPQTRYIGSGPKWEESIRPGIANFRSLGPVMTTMLDGGQIDLYCDTSSSVETFISDRRVTAFANTANLHPKGGALSDIPTLSELGFGSAAFAVWYGLVAPKGTPPQVIEMLGEALRSSLESPGFRKRTEQLGLFVISDDRRTSQGYIDFVRRETTRWLPLIRSAGQFVD